MTDVLPAARCASWPRGPTSGGFGFYSFNPRMDRLSAANHFPSPEEAAH